MHFLFRMTVKHDLIRRETTFDFGKEKKNHNFVSLQHMSSCIKLDKT